MYGIVCVRSITIPYFVSLLLRGFCPRKQSLRHSFRLHAWPNESPPPSPESRLFSIRVACQKNLVLQASTELAIPSITSLPTAGEWVSCKSLTPSARLINKATVRSLSGIPPSTTKSLSTCRCSLSTRINAYSTSSMVSWLSSFLYVLRTCFVAPQSFSTAFGRAESKYQNEQFIRLIRYMMITQISSL
jgi:hypothetical protein